MKAGRPKKNEKPKHIKTKCDYCGKNIIVYNSVKKLNKKHFCDSICYHTSTRNKKELICKICGKSYMTHKSHIKHRGSSYCSRKCMGEGITKFRSGENNHAWKGGKSPINRRLRAGKKWKVWREAIFKRDDYTCKNCGEKGGLLHPHHIKKFADFPDLRFDINNGITLCITCHKDTHKNEKTNKDIFNEKSRQIVQHILEK